MYNSLQHFNEFGTRKIEETIKNFINEKKDLADLCKCQYKNVRKVENNYVQKVS